MKYLKKIRSFFKRREDTDLRDDQRKKTAEIRYKKMISDLGNKFEMKHIRHFEAFTFIDPTKILIK
jgi:hypothetical protein